MTPLATYTTDEMQRELLMRAIARHDAEIERLRAQIAGMKSRQATRMNELLAVSARIVAAADVKARAQEVFP